MYDYISGKLAYLGSDHIVIDNGGIGYRVLTSKYSIEMFMKATELVTCFTELIVREDAMLLVGFSSRDELELFHKLTSVSGVGTKVGIAILSHDAYLNVATMIAKGDVKGLTAAPGVGKKTAERLVLELKDKVSSQDLVAYDTAVEESPSTTYQDALEALITLGYMKGDAQNALKGLDLTNMTTEMVIKSALKKIMGLG